MIQVFLRIALIITLLAYVFPLEGQDPQSHDRSKQTCMQEICYTGSLAVFGTTSISNGRLYGASFDRRLSFWGIKYNRTLFSKRFISFSYTPEIIPLVILSQPAIGDFAVSHKNPPFTRTQIAYGAGVNPVGAELAFIPHKRLHPFIGTTGGFLYFSRNVPSAFAAQFNFAISVSSGVKVILRDGRGMSLAYVFHHFSNGYEAHENPGLDCHMIHLGYTFRSYGRLRLEDYDQSPKSENKYDSD